MILYEDAALVVLDKPAGLSSEEGVPAALSRQVTQSQDAYAVQDGRAEGKATAPQFVKQYRAVIAGAPDAQLPAAGVRA